MGGIKLVTRRIKGGLLGPPIQREFLRPCQTSQQELTSTMKLLRVLVLVALPLYCLAGSGCLLLEEAINKAIDSQVSIDEYQNFLQPFTYGLETNEAIAELKQCFLQQSDETRSNFALMMVTIVFPDVLSNQWTGTSRL
uniref:Secretoglobin family 2A member 2 n=2 Tax=Canis lupus familiaris TaxID=9615 RepID=A0A8I3NC85_CANLF